MSELKNLTVLGVAHVVGDLRVKDDLSVTGSIHGTADRAISASRADSAHEVDGISADTVTGSIEAAVSGAFTEFDQVDTILTASIGGVTKHVGIASASYALSASFAKNAEFTQGTASFALQAAQVSHSLYITGYVNASYNGASDVTVDIPNPVDVISSASGLLVPSASWAGSAEQAKNAGTLQGTTKEGLFSAMLISGSDPSKGEANNDLHVTVGDVEKTVSLQHSHSVALNQTGSTLIMSVAGHSASVNISSASHASNTPYSHTHGNKEFLDDIESKFIPVTGGTVAGSLTINENLTVKGTATYIDTQHLNVKDTLVLLASGSTTKAAANGAGIAVQTASATTQEEAEAASARIQYIDPDDRFVSSVGFIAPSFTGSLNGTASEAIHAVSANSTPYSHEHSNKSVLDGISADTVSRWNGFADTGSEAYRLAVDAYNTASLAKVEAQRAKNWADSASVYAGDAETAKVAAQGSAGDASAAATQAAGFQSAASSSAAGAVSYNTQASQSAASAAGYTSAAETSKNNAASYESQASTSKTNAANYATAASQSAASAAGSAVAASSSAGGAAGYNTQASQSAASAAGYASAASNQASAAGTYAGNASASMENARTYASQAGSSKDSAASYATQASQSAASAASYASSANTSKNNAASYESAANTSKTNAASYESQANTSKTNAGSYASAASQSAYLAQSYQAAANVQFTGLNAKSASWDTAYGWGNHANAGYLKTSGGTVTGKITRDSGGSWISAREHVIIQTTRTSSEGSDYHPVVGIKTSAGFWSLGSVGGESLCFSYDTDANYSSGTNTSIRVDIPRVVGTLALTSQIPTNTNQLTNGAGFITSAGSCAYATSAGSAGSATSASRAVSAASADAVAWSNVSSKPETATRWPSWTEVTSKPSTFTPAAHSHAWSEVSHPAETTLACPVTSSGATTGTVTLQPGTVTNCGTLTGNLTLALANGNESVGEHCPIYHVVFNMGSSLRTITLPTGVSVMNSSAELDTTGVVYEISIMNNVAVIGRTGD